MIKCEKCGTPVSENSLKCSKCGAEYEKHLFHNIHPMAVCTFRKREDANA